MLQHQLLPGPRFHGLQEKLVLAFQDNVSTAAEQIAGSLLAQLSDLLFNQGTEGAGCRKTKAAPVGHLDSARGGAEARQQGRIILHILRRRHALDGQRQGLFKRPELLLQVQCKREGEQGRQAVGFNSWMRRLTRPREGGVSL